MVSLSENQAWKLSTNRGQNSVWPTSQDRQWLLQDMETLQMLQHQKQATFHLWVPSDQMPRRTRLAVAALSGATLPPAC